MVEIQALFDVKYGTKLDLNKLTLDESGVPLVSRTAKNNGVSAKVKPVEGIECLPVGSISVSLGGTILASFVQLNDFYTAQNVAVLIPKEKMTLKQKLFICLCIERNRFRYSAFGREANRTLKHLLIPALEDIPDWVNNVDLAVFDGIEKPFENNEVDLNINNWSSFKYDDLFSIERGRGPRKKDLDGKGDTPVITSSDSNNGLSGFTTVEAKHRENTIGVNRNGSVAEAFYHHYPYCSTEDVHIFTPKFEDMNQYVALFLITLIRKEKYRYSYGRKWGIARMKDSTIKLPVNEKGKPNFNFMELYIKSLKFSRKI